MKKNFRIIRIAELVGGEPTNIRFSIELPKNENYMHDITGISVEQLKDLRDQLNKLNLD